MTAAGPRARRTPPLARVCRVHARPRPSHTGIASNSARAGPGVAGRSRRALLSGDGWPFWTQTYTAAHRHRHVPAKTGNAPESATSSRAAPAAGSPEAPCADRRGDCGSRRAAPMRSLSMARALTREVRRSSAEEEGATPPDDAAALPARAHASDAPRPDHEPGSSAREARHCRPGPSTLGVSAARN